MQVAYPTLFSSGTRSSRYEYLRDVQREVFDAWHERRTERDLVIKMNTGNGKTLVGLMLLKSALNEHAGPAAYLTPDPVYLVDQVEAAAGDLGLSTSRDPRDPAVASGSAILLATVKTLFNGRSKFGVAPEGRKIKLGTVLIDDAHACLATVEEQFEIRLPATHPAYGQLLTLFGPSLRQQQPAYYRTRRTFLHQPHPRSTTASSALSNFYAGPAGALAAGAGPSGRTRRRRGQPPENS